jgi:hypothetical protein
MRIGCCRAMIAAVVLVAGGSAYAQSPEVREAEAREETALAAGVKRTNELCGARITVTFDWPALVPTGRLTETKPGALARQCDEALEGIRKLCRSHPSERQAAATQITRMVCSFGSKSPAVSLKDRTLTYMIDLDLAFPNNDIMVYDQLMDTLVLDGQTLIMRTYMPYAQESISKLAARINDLCQSSIRVRFDWSRIPSVTTRNAVPLGFCEHVLDATERVCVDAAGKDAVRKGITSIVCGFAAGRSISLKEGVLEFNSDFKASDDRSFIFEYLQSHL